MAPRLSIDQMNELFYIAGYQPPIRTRDMQIPCDVPDWAIILFGHLYLKSKNYDAATAEFDRLVQQFIQEKTTTPGLEKLFA